MGKIITVTGISGAGKSTFARQLSQAAGMPAYLERHGERPFHDSAAGGTAMLANQLDFLLYRATQEREMRTAQAGGVTDGGLETDYRVFTRLFHSRGLLNEAEYALCGRYYRFFRSLLPPPELIIYLHAPVEVVTRRFEQRARAREVSRAADLAAQQTLIEEWLAGEDPTRVLRVDASEEDPGYSRTVAALLSGLREFLPPARGE